MLSRVKRGVTKQNKIVGGTEVSPHTLPYQISFQDASSEFHFCGGTVYTEVQVMWQSLRYI